MKIIKENIMKLFRDDFGTFYEFRDIMRMCGVGKDGRRHLKSLVDELVDEGKLARQKGNRYGRAAAAAVTGRLSSHRDGYGFVTPDEGGSDIFIPARYLRENLHGDRVEVRVVARDRSGKSEGRIIRTVERANTRIVGTYQKTKNFGYLLPDEQRITRDIFIPPGADGEAENGQIVVAEITVWPTADRAAEGRVVEVLGWPDD
jgi:ribonuclease R